MGQTQIQKTLTVSPKSEDILKHLSKTNVVLPSNSNSYEIWAVTSARASHAWAD